MKKLFLSAVLLVCLLLVSGCSALFPDPMQKAQATMVPGVTAQLHSPLASDSNMDNQTVTLYFRYGKEPMLAAEARILSVSQDEAAEKALVQAILDGPAAGSTELTRLFPDQVQVLNTVPQGSILYVTFNDAVLRPYSDETGDMTGREDFRREKKIRRKLAMASLTASIIENFPYQSVQVLVQQRSDVSTSLRLENAYFQDENLPGGLSAPFLRDESLLLTQENTVRTIISAWQQKDWSRLYLYLATVNPLSGQERPSQEAAYAAWDNAAAVIDYDSTGGSVSPDGSRAMVSVDLKLVLGDAQETAVTGCPVMLYRDKGIWKMTYEQLITLMNTAPDEGE